MILWLTGNETIDHTTIEKFLIKYREDVVELFTQTVLIDFTVLAIDSVRLRVQIKIFLDSVQKEEVNDLELKTLEARGVRR